MSVIQHRNGCMMLYLHLDKNICYIYDLNIIYLNNILNYIAIKVYIVSRSKSKYMYMYNLNIYII